MRKMLQTVLLFSGIGIMAFICGCQKNSSAKTSTFTPPNTAPTAQSVSSEAPLAPEKNPPGDIPDTQVFISYTSKQDGYTVDAPEGWARTEHTGNVLFADKYDVEEVKVSLNSMAPSLKNVQRRLVPTIQQQDRAVTILGVKSKSMPHGQPILYVSYTSNSEPDAVTNKQVRLENETFFFFKGNRLAQLTLRAPLGADNADQWKRISESFRWK
jgi:hypothetical protein